MTWVDYEGVTFNLDHVTRFGIEENGYNSELRAYLSFGDAQVEKDPIAYFIVTMDTYEACKNLVKKIIAGDYNLPSQAYPITEYLKAMNVALAKIARNVELLAEKQQ